MNKQIITTPSGEKLVVLPEADYEALVSAAEDNLDRAAVLAFRQRLADGEEEAVPAVLVRRILDGENPVKVWREHRGLNRTDLARATGLSQPYISQIESGTRTGTKASLSAIAKALNISLDDL